jgi:hypothetical protein
MRAYLTAHSENHLNAWWDSRDAAWAVIGGWQAMDQSLDALGLELPGALSAAQAAILALMAWDDCGYLLSTDPNQVRTLALLGHQPATLLLPAVIALNKSMTYST